MAAVDLICVGIRRLLIERSACVCLHAMRVKGQEIYPWALRHCKMVRVERVWAASL